MLVGCILSIVAGFSYFIPVMVISILISTLELGVIRSCFKACDRKAKDVNTMKYTLMGIKEYPSAFSVFVGKKLIVIIIQMMIIVGAMLFLSGDVEHAFACLRALLTGSMTFIQLPDATGIIQWAIPVGMVLALALAVIVGFLLDIKFALTYYFAVDKDYSLFESLSASWKAMRGNTFSYIGLLLRFALPYLGAMVAIYLSNMALTNGFGEMVKLLPALAMPIAALMTVIIACATTAFAVMIYRVKMQLAITLFYKKITSEK